MRSARFRDIHLYLDAGSFSEAAHPRGQPKNAGQFVKKGGEVAGKVAKHGGKTLARVVTAGVSTSGHKEAIKKVLGPPRSEGRSRIAHGLMTAARAPDRILRHMVHSEAKEWHGACAAVASIVQGKKPNHHAMHALHSIAFKALTMVSVAAMTGSLSEMVGTAAWHAIGHELVTHTIAEHVIKFGASGAALGMKGLMGLRKKGGDTIDAEMSEAQIMSMILSWLAEGVQTAPLSN